MKDMLNKLKGLYKRYLKFERNQFLKDFKFWVRQKYEKEKALKVYQVFQKTDFLDFLISLKKILFSKNLSEVLIDLAIDNWDLWYLIYFLREEGIIEIKTNGEISVKNKKLLIAFSYPKTEREIEKILEKKLKKKIERKRPIFELYKNLGKFELKEKWDQLFLSQESVIFLVKKILEYPISFEKFLFLGDDDLVSLTLSLVEPKIKCQVLDIDEELLKFIERVKRRFHLKIETKLVDFRKKLKIKEKFFGLLTSPPDNYEGVKTFLNFGLSLLKKEGGLVFLEMGRSTIEKRIFYLGDFFNKKKLILEELITGKIYYPHQVISQEDKIISERFLKLVKENYLREIPSLSIKLWIFQYLPQFKKRKMIKTNFYDYL